MKKRLMFKQLLQIIVVVISITIITGCGLVDADVLKQDNEEQYKTILSKLEKQEKIFLSKFKEQEIFFNRKNMFCFVSVVRKLLSVCFPVIPISDGASGKTQTRYFNFLYEKLNFSIIVSVGNCFIIHKS